MIPLVIESWVWYAFSVALIVARIISRLLLFGSAKKLQIDDWLMIFTFATFTTLVVTLNIVADENSNLLPPGFDPSTLTPEDIKSRQYGSKLTLVVEQCQCFTVWTTKVCLLIMYYRLTFGLTENRIILFLAGYVAFSFALMEILYFAVWCRPFHNYWAVPTPSTQCSAATNHLITNAVFNISSDLAMLTIALQMIIRTHLPWKRKAILCIIFGLAVFTIVAAALNKYYSFTMPFSVMWTYWYVRESATCILVANLPFTWTILRRVFKLAAFDPNSTCPPERPRYHSARTAGGRRNYGVIHGVSPHTHKTDGTGGGSGNDSVIGTNTHHSHSIHVMAGHRGGGRSARAVPASKGHLQRPQSSMSKKEKDDGGAWKEESLSSRSEKAVELERTAGTWSPEPPARAHLPPEQMV